MLNSKQLNVINKMLDDIWPNPITNVLLWAIVGLTDDNKSLPTDSPRILGNTIMIDSMERAMAELDKITQEESNSYIEVIKSKLNK